MHFISKINLAGAFAKEFFDAPDEAKIIGVFRRSLYIEDASDRLACVGERGIGPGPLNALCEFSDDIDFTQIVEPGSPVEFRDAWIRLGPRMKIDISRPMEWKPEPLPIGWGLEFFLENLSYLVRWFDKTGSREGLAPLIKHIVSGEEVLNQGAFQTFSWKRISDFRHWLSHSLLQGEKLEFPADAHQLVGLGAGLTPSGDDFWCGVMVALRVLGHFEISDRIANTILSQAKDRTNKISYAHLECAAKGQGAQALHESISAMGMADEARLSSALRTLDKIGHTSGWDSLAGIVCVLKAVAKSKNHSVSV